MWLAEEGDTPVALLLLEIAPALAPGETSEELK